MTQTDFTATMFASKTPEATFNAINNVTGWWANNFTGNSQKEGDEFEVRFGDAHYSRQRLTEMVPGKKIVWLVTDSYLDFVEDKTEWTGTRIIFDLAPEGDKTRVQFTHEGLVPGVECFNGCTNAWGQYFRYSLVSFINTGKGQPGFPPKGPVE